MNIITYEILEDEISEKDRLNKTFSRGGEEELNSAIELYGQGILKYCHSILCDYHEAEDAVQLTFIKAFNKRKKFEAGTSLSAWLYRIAYTTCIDITRKKKFETLFYEAPKNHEPLYKDGYISEDLRDALLTISPKDRAPVFSRVLDEIEYSELQVIYNASAAALRKRYERAKRKLAAALMESQNP